MVAPKKVVGNPVKRLGVINSHIRPYANTDSQQKFKDIRKEYTKDAMEVKDMAKDPIV